MTHSNAKMIEVISEHIVHELEPKKWLFGSGGWTKHNTVFSNLSVSTFRESMMSCANR